MKLYSDFGARRAYQIVGDVAAVVVLVVGIVVAVAIHNAIAAFRGIGADVARSGSDFSATMRDIGGRLSGVPLIGPGIGAPFANASHAGSTLADAGASWQAGVEHLATLVGWTLAVLVVLVVLLGWVRPRIVAAVRSGAAARLAAGPLDLLALRALVTGRAAEVTALDDDVVAAWRREDPEVIRRLAALELRASGVRLPER